MRSVNRVVKRCSSWVSSCSSMTTSCGKVRSDDASNHDVRSCNASAGRADLSVHRLHRFAPMSLVRGMPIFALVAIACAGHAKQLAKSATQGVKAQVAQIDPAVARTLGDQAARGAVSGALSELASDEHRDLIDEIVDTTSAAAARGVVIALRPDA